jgi:hypothetical protein
MHPSQWEEIEWDEHNLDHVGRRVSPSELVEVLMNDPVWRRDAADQSGDWVAMGETDGGRRLVIVVALDEIRRVIRPITGWEQER